MPSGSASGGGIRRSYDVKRSALSGTAGPFTTGSVIRTEASPGMQMFRHSSHETFAFSVIDEPGRSDEGAVKGTRSMFSFEYP